MAGSTNDTAPPTQTDRTHSLVPYEGSQNVLSAMDAAIGDGDGMAGTNLVWVSPERTPDEIVRSLQDADVSGMPRAIDLVLIGDRVRAATATADTPSTSVVPFEPADLTVHGLRRDSEVDVIARSVLDCVDHIARGEQQIVLDDIGRLVTETSLEGVYRLLHLLTAKADLEGWTVTVGMDIERVEERTARTLEPLFDQVQ